MSVLIVEDDIGAGEALVGYLKKSGIMARWSSNLDDARAKIATKLPRVLVLDLSLDNERGETLIEESLIPKDKTIILSACPKEEMAVYPEVEVLLKPVAPEVIKQKVMERL